MKDIIFKLRTLLEEILSIPSMFKRWKEFVWDGNLDELACCNGRECGCMGVTRRQEVEHHYFPKKINYNNNHGDF